MGTNFPREFCPGGHYFQGDNKNCDNGVPNLMGSLKFYDIGIEVRPVRPWPDHFLEECQLVRWVCRSPTKSDQIDGLSVWSDRGWKGEKEKYLWEKNTSVTPGK